MKPEGLFDKYADEYEKELTRGISFFGESREYFARKRVEKTAQVLSKRSVTTCVLDFGCGTGDTLPMLVKGMGANSGVGVDVSSKSIDLAIKKHQSANCMFYTVEDLPDRNAFDLAYCNGVFHHIPPDKRGEALVYVHDRLKVGGYFAFWENNPWNPGTRLAMRRTSFDRDAVPITLPEAHRLLIKNGFEIEMSVTQFLIPKVLRYVRFLEKIILIAPIGAQYLLLARK
jgi:SAM-dependent methyltransferase